MKIGYIITGLGTGGAEKHLLKFLPNLKYDKFIISLTKNNSIGKIIQKKGIKVYYLNTNKFNFPIQIIKLISIIKKEKPNILDSYLIHANLLTRFLSKLMRIPNINSVRNDYSYSKFYTYMDRITSSMVDVYTPNSKALLTYLKKIKINSSKIDIINNFIIPKNLNFSKNIRKELNIPLSSKVFIMVSRFVKQKNHKILIEAFKEYQSINKNSYLILCGDGPLLNKYIDSEKNNSNMIFTGNVKNVSDYLNSSDVFILPSTREGMSNALLEAMYLKKTCIVSNIPTNRLLISEKTGYFFSNKKQLIKLMIKKKYGNKNIYARELVKKQYTLRTTLKKYKSILNRYI